MKIPNEVTRWKSSTELILFLPFIHSKEWVVEDPAWLISSHRKISFLSGENALYIKMLISSKLEKGEGKLVQKFFNKNTGC